MPYLLYFFVPLIPLVNITDKIPKLAEGLGFINVMMVVLVLAWIFSSRKGPLVEKTPFNVPLLLFILITYIGLWRGSFYVGEAMPLGGPRFTQWKDLMMLPMLYFLTVNNIKDRRELRIMVLLMVGVMFYMETYFWREIRWYNLAFYRDKLRWFRGTFSNLGSNEWSAFFAQYSMVVLGLYLFDKVKIRKLFFLFIFTLNMLVLLYTFSRAAYLAAFTGLAFICLAKERKLLPILAIILICYSTLFPTAMVQRVEMTQTVEGQLDPSAAARLDYWHQAWELFQQNPVIGTGLYTFIKIGYHRDTHNMYLNVLSELGLTGFLLFLYLFYLSIKHGWRFYKSTDDNFLKGLSFGFVAATIASMVTNMFGNRFSYLCLGGYHWVFLGLIMRASILERQVKAQS